LAEEGEDPDEGDGSVNLTIYGEADARTIAQIERCQAAEEGARAVLCADNHLGYSQPIGGAVAYRDHISPSGVGYDIGCGNKAVKTCVRLNDIERGERSARGNKRGAGISEIMDEIVRRVSFGMGRNNDEPAHHPVLDQIKEANFAPQRQLYDLAAKQLGTVGSGNHYVDLFVDENDFVWVGVHFGSRGFGHKTASGFLALAQGLKFEEHANEGEMDSPPVVFPTDSELGQAYIEAMQLAGAYAYAGRDVVVQTVLDVIGTWASYEVHNHHNFAWREEHDGEQWWVVRKGCTPAFPGQQGFVGATMAEESVILEGTEDAAGALFSTVHGAGRVMSRTQAAGKKRKRWSCNNRDCDWVQPPRTHKPEDGCPDCGHSKLTKRWVQETEGAIDWGETIADLEAKGIELRGAAADEAPGAYKRLDSVLAAHGDTIRILHRLRPIGVAMAGSDIFDPFKD
jgi:tRNA-splicing ligase RtcB (3'-phosphate/5'-hydroxy nucleic acid ligase)